MDIENSKAKLLLDVCCGVCFAGVLEQLASIYDIVVYWHNANMFPEEEYQKRLDSYKKSFPQIKTIIDNDNWERNHKTWLCSVDGENMSDEPEGGKRCIKCYQYRIERVAKYAKEHNFDLFASTLTISPHKNAEIINKIGMSVESGIPAESPQQNLERLPFAQDDKPKFLSADFKKKDGFKKANQKAKELSIYRQNYCGCEFSIPVNTD